MTTEENKTADVATWEDSFNFQPGVSMPDPIPKLNPGLPFPIPKDRLVSNESLSEPIHSVNAEDSALAYLMSNQQDFCVILTQCDKQTDSFCCNCGDTFETPEKLIAGSVQTPLYDITSWEDVKHGNVANYIGFREKRHVLATDQELSKLKDSKASLFLTHFCGFAYKSEKEGSNWKRTNTFSCTYMNEIETNNQMIKSFKNIWNQAHSLDSADFIIKATDLDGNGIRVGWDPNNKDLSETDAPNVIGRALMVPFEFSETHRRRRQKAEHSTSYWMDHSAIYNLELRIYQCDESGKPDQIQYRVRAVSSFPEAEQSYQEVQSKNNEVKPEDMKGTDEVYFAILDGSVHLPIEEHSVLGSVVMQSGSNRMVIKFPKEANEDDRIRLFTSLVMLENFMRSRTARDTGYCGRCWSCTIL